MDYTSRIGEYFCVVLETLLTNMLLRDHVIKKPRNGKFCNVHRSVGTRDALASKKYAIKKLQPIGISIKEAYGKILANIMGKGSHENSRLHC